MHSTTHKTFSLHITSSSKICSTKTLAPFHLYAVAPLPLDATTLLPVLHSLLQSGRISFRFARRRKRSLSIPPLRLENGSEVGKFDAIGRRMVLYRMTNSG
ncbi:hypothetical protein Hanom_Chr16g01424221 [Helianthus anomalus]